MKTQPALRHVSALFETSNLKEACILFFISIIRVQCQDQNEKFKNEADVYQIC